MFLNMLNWDYNGTKKYLSCCADKGAICSKVRL